MVVFLQKCRNEFKGVNDVETQSSILLDIVVTMPIHAIFFMAFGLRILRGYNPLSEQYM